MKKNITTLLMVFLALAVSVGFAAAKETDETITNIEDIKRGTTVKLQGNVSRILDEDEFRLEDDTGSVKIYIGWRNRVVVDVGERVTVKGFVDNDLIDLFRPEVYAQELIREDGTPVKLR